MKGKIFGFLNKFSDFDIFSLGNSAFLYYFIIFYFMPILAFFGMSIKFVPTSSIIPYKALAYATVGLVFFAAGYFARLPILISKKTPNLLKEEWDFLKAFWIFGITFSIGLAIKIFRILGGGYAHLNVAESFVRNPLYNLIGTFDWISYVALAIAFISYYHKRKSQSSYRIWQILAWGTLLLEILYALPSCSRMSAIVPIMIFVIIRWYTWKRSFLSVIIIAIIISLFLFPFGNACRTPNALLVYQINILKIKLGLSANPASLLNKEGAVNLVNNSAKFAADSFLSRVNQSRVFSAILDKTSSLQYGKSFKEIALVFSPPRFIWKTKPISVNAGSNEFGHRIGVLSDEDHITGVGPTIVGDWFMNFGILGIIGGMFLTGMLFRFIYEFLIRTTNSSLSGVMVYSVLWIHIIKGMEDWVAPVYVGVIRIFVIMIIVHLLLIKRRI